MASTASNINDARSDVASTDQVTANLIGSAGRRRDVQASPPKFGYLPTLTLVEHLAVLNAQLHDWRRTRAPSPCNHRLHALTHLVRVLYGRRAAIDLADMVRFPLPLPRPRWVDRAHIKAVLQHLSPATRTSAQLRLTPWSGMRPSQTSRLARSAFHLAAPVPVRHRRARQGRPLSRHPSRRPCYCRRSRPSSPPTPSAPGPPKAQTRPSRQAARKNPATALYRVSDPPLLCDVAPTPGRRPPDIQGPVPPHQRCHHKNLCRADSFHPPRRKSYVFAPCLPINYRVS